VRKVQDSSRALRKPLGKSSKPTLVEASGASSLSNKLARIENRLRIERTLQHAVQRAILF
jgi:hypothetical protein